MELQHTLQPSALFLHLGLDPCVGQEGTEDTASLFAPVTSVSHWHHTGKGAGNGLSAGNGREETTQGDEPT